jgi:hypothetical protein
MSWAAGSAPRKIDGGCRASSKETGMREDAMRSRSAGTINLLLTVHVFCFFISFNRYYRYLCTSLTYILSHVYQSFIFIQVSYQNHHLTNHISEIFLALATLSTTLTSTATSTEAATDFSTYAWAVSATVVTVLLAAIIVLRRKR